MTLLPASEIAEMRAVAEQTFDGSAVIEIRQRVSDGAGDSQPNWVPTGTVDCHLSPIHGYEREQGERISADADWVVTVPALTAVTPKHRLVINNTVYNVAAVRSPRTWELTRRVEVNEET